MNIGKTKKLSVIIVDLYKNCVEKSNNSLFSVYVENYLRSAIELLTELKYDDAVINEFKTVYADLMNCTINYVDEFCKTSMTTLLKNPITISQITEQINKISEKFLSIDEFENIRNIIENIRIPNKTVNSNSAEYDNSYLYKYPNGYPMNYSYTGDITMPY